MKRLFKNINKTSLVITLLVHFVAYQAHAGSTVGIISSMKGNAFVTYKGNTLGLKVGDEIGDFSEILTTSGSQITFTDYYDHQFHLSGSGHMKIMNKNVELKRGYLWVQSFRNGSGSGFSVNTANAHVDYDFGEGIMSFDPASGKSQLLVIKGTFVFGNLLDKTYSLPVEDGHFSFLSNDEENGIPRQSTPVGFSSFKNVTSLFNGVQSMDKSTRPSREVASAPTQKFTKPGTVKYVKSKEASRIPASSPEKKSKLLNFYYQKVGDKKGKIQHRLQKSGVPVKIYGAGKTWKRNPASSKPRPEIKREEKPEPPHPSSKSQHVKRDPASVSIQQVEIKTDAFEQGLTKEYTKQMRHSSEVNSLIKDLKSYDKDFKTAY